MEVRTPDHPKSGTVVDWASASTTLIVIRLIIISSGFLTDVIAGSIQMRSSEDAASQCLFLQHVLCTVYPTDMHAIGRSANLQQNTCLTRSTTGANEVYILVQSG